MSAVRPPHINAVMIAAADLENAEFERDRLAMVCGEAIRHALATGLTPAHIAKAANLAESEVRRLAEALPTGGDGVGGDRAAGIPDLPGPDGEPEPFLIGLHLSDMDAVYPEAPRPHLGTSRGTQAGSPMAHPDAAAVPEAPRRRVALLIIDMQNAFFENEVLAREQDAVVAACNGLIDAAQRGGAPILVARTEHLPDRSTWTVSMLDDDQGFIFSGTHQADAVEGLRVEGLETVTKTRDSAFFGTDLAERLRRHGVERLVLAGVSTHNCVAHTGADAFAHDFRVSYVLDAIASTNAQYAAAMLEILSVEYRQPVIGQAEAEVLLG